MDFGQGHRLRRITVIPSPTSAWDSQGVTRAIGDARPCRRFNRISGSPTPSRRCAPIHLSPRWRERKTPIAQAAASVSVSSRPRRPVFPLAPAGGEVARRSRDGVGEPPMRSAPPGRAPPRRNASWPPIWAHLEQGSGPTRTCTNGMAIINRGFITGGPIMTTKGRRCVTYVRFQSKMPLASLPRR